MWKHAYKSLAVRKLCSNRSRLQSRISRRRRLNWPRPPTRNHRTRKYCRWCCRVASAPPSIRAQWKWQWSSCPGCLMALPYRQSIRTNCVCVLRTSRRNAMMHWRRTKISSWPIRRTIKKSWSAIIYDLPSDWHHWSPYRQCKQWALLGKHTQINSLRIQWMTIDARIPTHQIYMIDLHQLSCLHLHRYNSKSTPLRWWMFFCVSLK